MIIFSEVTESAKRKAFSSTATMRPVAACPASSLPRSIQPWWFFSLMRLLLTRTTFWTRAVTIDSRLPASIALWKINLKCFY